MLIGTKLDLDFAERESYRRLFGRDPADAYRALADLGFRFIEWPLPQTLDEEALTRLVEGAADHRLLSYFHPYPNAANDASRFSEDPDSASRSCLAVQLGFAHRVGVRHGYQPVVNFHGGSSYHWTGVPATEEGREALMAPCLAFFGWAMRRVAERSLQVLVTSEVQLAARPEETFFRLGDRFMELLRMAEAAPGLGLCWDMGHSTLNHLHWRSELYPLDPPPAFAPLVRHVHLHDIEGRSDHKPLIYGTVDLERHFRTLRSAGFHGSVNLEVPPPFIAECGDFHDLAARSITRIQEVWNATAPLGG